MYFLWNPHKNKLQWYQFTKMCTCVYSYDRHLTINIQQKHIINTQSMEYVNCVICIQHRAIPKLGQLVSWSGLWWDAAQMGQKSDVPTFKVILSRYQSPIHFPLSFTHPSTWYICLVLSQNSQMAHAPRILFFYELRVIITRYNPVTTSRLNPSLCVTGLLCVLSTCF